MDTSSAEFKAALRDHAKSLGVDLDADAHLIALVEEALLAEVPDGWEQGETEDGTLYYFNSETEESIWEHPLDAHYRDLIRAKKQDHSASGITEAAPAKVPAPHTPLSSVEVYSFDEDSDDGIEPMAKMSTAAAKEGDNFSRISSLFSQPASSPSPVSVSASPATGASTASGGAGGGVMASSSSPAASGLGKNETNTSGGFGRDRSWLLDNDDDDGVVGFSSLGRTTTAGVGGDTVSPLSTPTPSLSTHSTAKIESFGGRDDDAFAGSRTPFGASTTSSGISTRGGAAYSPSSISTGAAAATTAASLSFASRMYGTSTSPSTVSASAMDVSSSSSTGGGGSGSGTSPRRGIGSSIKNQFFQEMPSAAAATTPASAFAREAAASSASLPADLARIQQLEKKAGELTKQNEQLVFDLRKAREQAEHAQLEAKESNYLKMKAGESKAKLAEKDAEFKKLTQDHSTLVSRLQLELQQLKSESERLAKTQLQQASVSSQEVIEMQRGAMAEKTALVGEINELERKLRDAQLESARHQSASAELAAKVATLEAALERERHAHSSEVGALRDSLEQRRKDHDEELRQRRKDHDAELEQLRGQAESLKREAAERERRSESVGAVQDTLERQSRLLKEVEEKNRELQSRLALAEEKLIAATRDATSREQQSADAAVKLRTVLAELEAKERQLGALGEKLRLQGEQTAALESKNAALLRQEDELKRESRALSSELRDKSEELQRLQSQARRQSDAHLSLASKLQAELQEAQNDLKVVKLQEMAPLEKQSEQLRRESERLGERLALQDKELRQAALALADANSQLQQLQAEVESWRRKEQQHKAQRDALYSEKLALEKHAAELAAEHTGYKNTKRLELEKLAFRQRELESQVAQKDYEVLRVEERFAKAEAWRLKEARRVEERDAQLLDAKEELAQLRSRNVEAENAAVLQEMRREREQLQLRAAQLAQALEDEKLARVASGQKFHDELNMLQKGLEWQLPQLAVACVSRSSEEWGRKCQQVAKALRDDFQLKALAERNAALGTLQRAEDARERAEQKLKNAVAECEFLRKEVHRVEDNNKVLLDQLHTVRVYMTQRSVPASFASAPWMAPMPPAPHQYQNQHHPSAPPPAPAPVAPAPFGVPFTDFSTINHLNTQLGVLHAQFQQLFDATERRPPGLAIPTPRASFSPSDRFEIPSSPTAADALLDQPRESSEAASSRSKELENEKEQLISTLEALAPEGTGASLEHPLVAGGSSAWYQRDYWRSKYPPAT